MLKHHLLRACAIFLLVALVAACGDSSGGDGGAEPTSDSAAGPTPDSGEGGDEPAETITLTYAGVLPADYPGQRLMQHWADKVEEFSDGRVEFEIFHGGSLLSIDDVVTGVGDGRADMGYGASLYHPAALPLSTVAEIPLLTRDTEAQMRAADELYRTNDAFRQEHTDLGVEVLLFFPAGTTLLASAEPVTGVDDIQGKQVRAVGRVAQAITEAGGNVHAMPFGEIYESVQRGLIDVITNVPLGAIYAGGLYEVAPNIYDPGFGEAQTLQPFVINSNVWESLPDEVKDAMQRATDEYWRDFPEMLMEFEGEACEDMLASGATFETWPAEERQRWEELVGEEFVEEWVEDLSGQGVPAEEFLDEYLALLEQYEQESTFAPTVEACANR